MSENFYVTVHGKWILAGEHAVLRGCPALAFPVYGKQLSLRWNDGEKFEAIYSGERGEEFRLLFAGVFDRALEILGLENRSDLKRGRFEVASTLPVGAGLGASAALAVAVGRWFAEQGAVSKTGLFEFCRQIENLFHGESSGVDVAVALQEQGLSFVRGGEMRAFSPSWQPVWYISYSGARGITSECVAKVKALIERDPAKGAAIDARMHEAVQLAENALKSESRSNSDLAKAIEIAGSCFEEWDLAGGELARHLDWLKKSGAIAVKPTGSGGGGYALSLWEQPPNAEVATHLVPVFRISPS